MQVSHGKSDSKDKGPSDANLALSFVAPKILAELAHLDLSGSVLFEENKVIGGGAYGDISKGQCDFSGRSRVAVAIKRLRFYLKEDFKLLFEKEIYVWSKLKHPNILPLLGYAFDQTTGYPLLVSVWMDNGSAWTYVNAVPNCDVLGLVEGIARGLVYLHELGVVHSDIKSDNVLVSPTGDAVICDFGCARVINASRSLANFSTGIRGTPRYLAYELLAVPRTSEEYTTGHTSKSDVWAFGMTTFELSCRQRPYANLSDMQVISAITTFQLPRFPDSDAMGIGSEAAEMIKALCMDCWNHNPTRRLAMSSILDAFKHIPRKGRQDSPAYHEGTRYTASINGNNEYTTSIPALLHPKIRTTAITNVSSAHTLRHDGMVTYINFSADGKYLTTCSGRVVRIFSSRDGRQQRVLDYSVEGDEQEPHVRDVCFSRDNMHLAAGYEDKTIRIWSIKGQKVIESFTDFLQEIYSLDFSRTGSYILTGSGDVQGACILHRKSGSRTIIQDTRVPVPDASISCVAICPREVFIATGALDGVVRIWSINSGKLVGRLFTHDEVFWVTFVEDDSALITAGCDRKLRLWNISTILDVNLTDDVFTQYESVDELDYSAGNRHVLDDGGEWKSGERKGSLVKFWEFGTKQIKLLLNSEDGKDIPVFLSPGAKMIATGIADNNVSLWWYDSS